jgi:single-strand DNA-binding protein
MSINRVVLAGNLTRDPEQRHTSSGTAVLNATIAVNDRRKQGDEWVDAPNFIDLTFWGRSAEVITEYCSKGQLLFVDGKMRQESWTNEDGDKRTKISVTVNEFQFGSSGRSNEKSETAELIAAGMEEDPGF